ncbi:MAG TPA: class I adenylate-forming enzyme family protein [Gaiellaceae bacterium]|jgi:acyl-coenzyme A synthetase/AMP-(fatty) acid ligase|nr:class I adenylate-forming enzyme family protein [Gaiellaceae bacterium]
MTAALEAVAVESPDVRVTHAQLAADPFRLRDLVGRGGRAAVFDAGAVGVLAALVALDGWASDVYLAGALRPELPPGTCSLSAEAFVSPLRDTGRSPGDLPAGAVTRWHLFTSGTTGEPRAVSHPLAALARSARPGPARRGRRWGLLYEPTRMAGIQVLLQGLTATETVLDATGLRSLGDRIDWLVGARVSALSATPTLWRQILQTPRSDRLELDQITLGGEIADRRVLHALGRAFPDARITHVFASTETGVAFSVSDRQEGFPASYLTDPPSGIRLEVRDGILFVEAPHASVSGLDGFVSTGDLVAVDDDRVRFLGRASGVVNVGGTKVSPEQVESVLREHPDVLDSVVVARRSPFSGWILTAQIVAAPRSDESSLPDRLRRFCGTRLETAAVPAIVKIVPALSSPTGKAGRT